MTDAKLTVNPPAGSGLTNRLLDRLYSDVVQGKPVDLIPVTGLLEVVGHSEQKTADGTKRAVRFQFARLEPAVNGDADTVTHLVEASYANRTTPEQPPLISDEDAKTELLRDIETWRDEEELSFDEVNAKFGAHFGEGFVVDSYRLASATQLREFALVLGVIDDPVITEAGTEQGDEPGEDGDLVDCEILGDGSDVPPAEFSDGAP
jgi:hypothetical protein